MGEASSSVSKIVKSMSRTNPHYLYQYLKVDDSVYRHRYRVQRQDLLRWDVKGHQSKVNLAELVSARESVEQTWAFG